MEAAAVTPKIRYVGVYPGVGACLGHYSIIYYVGKPLVMNSQIIVVLQKKASNDSPDIMENLIAYIFEEHPVSACMYHQHEGFIKVGHNVDDGWWVIYAMHL